MSLEHFANTLLSLLPGERYTNHEPGCNRNQRGRCVVLGCADSPVAKAWVGVWRKEDPPWGVLYHLTIHGRKQRREIVFVKDDLEELRLWLSRIAERIWFEAYQVFHPTPLFHDQYFTRRAWEQVVKERGLCL